MTFKGFSKEFFTFVNELSKNNNKAWFNDNKERYQDVVLSNLSEFIEAIGPRLGKISSHYIADPTPNGKSMFRIYRDVRFAKDKRPFHDHVRLKFFHEDAKKKATPGFYMHLDPEKVMFGAGIYAPPPRELEKIRKAIVTEPTEWKKATKSKKFVDCFPEGIEGEALKKPPKNFDGDLMFIDDIKRKTFFAMRTVSPKVARSDTFIREVEKSFKTSLPFVSFISDAISVRY